MNSYEIVRVMEDEELHDGELKVALMKIHINYNCFITFMAIWMCASIMCLLDPSMRSYITNAFKF